MHTRLAFIGFGNVARAFAEILSDYEAKLAANYNLRIKTIGIATASHGCVASAGGIDLVEAVRCVERGGSLTELPGAIRLDSPLELIEACDAHVLFETTPLNIIDGEPAVSYIRAALGRGINVITANKGPIAFAYRELKLLAEKHGASFRFEGTVMDGAPVFNLRERCLPAVEVLGFSGILNSTTNLILTGMESGSSFEEALAEARRRGIAEANADYDVDGWDAAMKTVALANVLMLADARPSDVNREGIRNVTLEDLQSVARSGKTLRLVARGKRVRDSVALSVAPEAVPVDSLLGSARGTTNVLVLETDLMGEIAIVENEPGIEQTAYALLGDLLGIREEAGLI